MWIHRIRSNYIVFQQVLLLVLVGFVFGLHYLQAQEEEWYQEQEGHGWYDQFSLHWLRVHFAGCSSADL